MVKFEYENISDAVFHHAATQPAATALISGLQSVSYAELAMLVGHATVYLRAQGLKAGDRIGIAMTNSVERIVLSLACLRMGATTLELATEIKAPELSALVARFALRSVAVETGGPDAPTEIPLTIGLDWRDQLAKLSGDARYEGDPSQLKLIILSSGSTGISKGMVSTHQQRVARALAHINSAGFYQQERPGVLMMAAAANTGFVSQFLMNQLFLGGTSVLLPDFRYLIELVRQLQAYEDALFPVPPMMVKQMLKYQSHADVLFPKMQALIVGGQPMTSQDKQEMVTRLTPNAYEIYGCAGCGLIAWVGPADIARQVDIVGKPIAMPGIEIEIIGANGEAAKPGTVGELRIRGPIVGSGFYHAIDNDRGTERFADGWYYPGDVGAMDRNGYLKLEGRVADAIKVGATMIYPPEIEDVIAKHPHVADVAVVGRPSVDGVDEIVAFVVGRPGFKHRDIEAYCKGAMPFAKRPKYIFYLDQMPKTPNGKVDKPALRAAPLKPIGPA